jgi:hypothetical protein
MMTKGTARSQKMELINKEEKEVRHAEKMEQIEKRKLYGIWVRKERVPPQSSQKKIELEKLINNLKHPV